MLGSWHQSWSGYKLENLRTADILRVHDVRFMARVAKMTAMIQGSGVREQGKKKALNAKCFPDS
ncbi:MAG: hypothetical protein AB7S81_07780 [Bdellovibrionales bacterium]